MNSQSQRVCVILPQLPPAIDGVGDYTIQLWRHFHNVIEPDASLFDAAYGWDLLCQGAESSSRVFCSARLEELPRDAEQLSGALERLNPGTVLLQFSGYGFDPNGLANFLLDGLTQWLRRDNKRRVITMFHELYASGPPWKKSFWLGRLQKNLAVGLCKISTTSITSNKEYFDKLKLALPNHDVRIIRIGSNFEPGEYHAKNWRRLSVFGRSRLDSLKLHQKLLSYLSDHNMIDTIVLSGERGSESQRQSELSFLRELPKKQSSAISIEEVYDFQPPVPESIACCGLALTNVRTSVLPKSSRFHLSCALGQVILSQSDHLFETTAEDPYLEYDNEALDQLLPTLSNNSRLETIAQNARHAAKTEFSWTEIGKKWREVLRTPD
ncbi:MAG: hypothetical protein K2Z81_22975, partial [Cyanobacteria bacterium]|nr:hypothetical protein [Cyanobacteriota bacterium]